MTGGDRDDADGLAGLAVIGASWGGLGAVGTILGCLDPGIRLAVAVALHRSANGPSGTLVHYFQGRCPVPVSEVEDKDAIVPGQVFVAPADYHLLVEPGHFALSIDAPVQYSRPSIDVLFESAADVYGDRVVAVVLTGANDDGCRGLRLVKEQGGTTIVQDPGTAERREMPDAAIATGAADHVVGLTEVAPLLNKLGREDG